MKNTDWQQYHGIYEKIFYDIELYDGKIFYECYPNAEGFHTKRGETINGRLVRNVRAVLCKEYW